MEILYLVRGSDYMGVYYNCQNLTECLRSYVTLNIHAHPPAPNTHKEKVPLGVKTVGKKHP